jgi:hypothetical protein
VRPVSGAETARQRAHGSGGLVAHLILDRARRRRQLDGERDLAAVDGQVLDEAERHDVAAKIRIDDDAKGGQDRLTVRG